MADHQILNEILESRQLTEVVNPIWKMSLTSFEYESLKRLLRDIDSDIFGSLWDYPQEAAICYAEWWRTEYNGGTPSKESIARAIGLSCTSSEELYEAAKRALRIWGVPIIRHWNSLRFRTLLLQGGLPLEYVKHNLGSYKLFLEGLVEELSQISADWEDTSIIPKLRCYWYLPRSFRNDDIFCLSLQIARAIIEERIDLLPYDSSSSDLEELTQALQKKWKESQKIVRRKPLSIQWEMRLKPGDCGYKGKLEYSLENVRNLYASSLQGFQPYNCYQFDVYVSKSYVATYKRVSSESGEAVYRRMNTTNVKFEWKGEPCIEVKIKTDQDQVFFATIDGCCPPDFSYPQLFHKRDHVYVQKVQELSDDNVVIFNKEWITDQGVTDSLWMADEEYGLVRITDRLEFLNIRTGETTSLINTSSSYVVEFKAPFLEWLEDSNYLLTNKVPIISVYDAENKLVKTGYKVTCRKKTESVWHELRYNIALPTGLLEFRVSLPDGTERIQSFYSIGNLSFEVIDVSSTAGIIVCSNVPGLIAPVQQECIEYTQLKENSWSVKRPETDFFPPTCSFKLLSGEDKPLEIKIPSPFKGICLVDESGNIVRHGKTLSMSNLLSYRIVERGKDLQSIVFSYTDKTEIENHISISAPVLGELVPLSNFEDTITRLFDLYGINPFDRTNAVTLTIQDDTYYIRNFTLDTRQSSENKVQIIKLNQNPLQFPYEGKLFACPAVDPNTEVTIDTIELVRINDEEFEFPEGCTGDYIVFSDVYDKDRIVPKFYSIQPVSSIEEPKIEGKDENEPKIVLKSLTQLRSLYSPLYIGETTEDVIERKKRQRKSISLWNQSLTAEDAISGISWMKVTEYMDVANEFRLPFNTFNTINAAVATPSLFAKLVLRMFLDGKKDDLVGNINKLEREYGIAVHWLRPDDFGATIDEIVKQPAFLIDNLLKGYSELFRELLTVTMEKDCADVISMFLMNGSKSQNTSLYFEPSELKEFRIRAKGKAEDDRDLPDDYLPLFGRYYDTDSVSKNSCRTTIVNAPLYVYEYLTGINDDLWSARNIRFRRVINFYRHYFLRTYCEILSKCFV